MTKVIYGLADEDDVVRYVGQSQDPVRRFEYHVSQAFRKAYNERDPVHRWIYQQLIGERHVPVIEILEFCEDAQAYEAERRWIEHFGYDQLTNVPYSVRHAKSRQARSKSMTGKKHSEETRKKMSESGKAAWEKRHAASR